MIGLRGGPDPKSLSNNINKQEFVARVEVVLVVAEQVCFMLF